MNHYLLILEQCISKQNLDDLRWRNSLISDWTAEEKQHLGEELSDVLLYLIRLSEKCGIDLPAAALKKIAKNELKYPATLVSGSSKKYTEYKAENGKLVTGLQDGESWVTAAVIIFEAPL